MDIDVLSTKIGTFWKNFALRFVTPQKFENKFWKFLKPTDDQASQLLLYNELSMPRSKILEINFFEKKVMKNFMKNLMKFFWIFSFLRLGLKIFWRKWYLGTNSFEIFSKFKKKFSKICLECDKSECKIFAKDTYFCTQDTNVHHI